MANATHPSAPPASPTPTEDPKHRDEERAAEARKLFDESQQRRFPGDHSDRSIATIGRDGEGWTDCLDDRARAAHSRAPGRSADRAAAGPWSGTGAKTTLMADIYNSNTGQWETLDDDAPLGRTINTPPETMTETPGGGDWTTLSKGGPISVINTPDSSRGTPFRYSPSALSPTPQQTGAPNTITPSSRSGAPPPAIRNVPTAQELMPSASQPMPGWASALATGSPWALGAYLMGKTIAPQPTNQGEEEVLKRFQPAPNSTIGTQTGTAIAPGSQTSPVTAPMPLTQPQGMPGRAVPPPMGPPIPPGGLPPPPLPPTRPWGAIPPIPMGVPQHPLQRAGAPNLGYGVPQPAQDPFAIHPSAAFTTIDRPNADIAGGRSVAGQLAPQYFNQAREPGGPAQMGALDLSGLFNHPAVAQAAAAHPAVQAAARAPVQGPLSALAPRAAAPVVQRVRALPQVLPRGASAVVPTYRNPAYGQGANVGLGN